MQEHQTPKTPELTTPEGKKYDIPVEGSLGLLALGYVGLMAWRAKRNEVAQQASKS